MRRRDAIVNEVLNLAFVFAVIGCLIAFVEAVFN